MIGRVGPKRRCLGSSAVRWLAISSNLVELGDKVGFLLECGVMQRWGVAVRAVPFELPYATNWDGKTSLPVLISFIAREAEHFGQCQI